MHHLLTLVSGLVMISLASVATAQQAPPMPVPQKEHAWPKQFAGEWETDMEAIMMPGQPAVKCKGSMSSRMLGGFWLMNEIKGDMMGTPMLGIQTIGYDAEKKKFVGTWVDSMTDRLWQYAGTVDASGKKLTLEADGPNMMAAGKMTKFRDVYEFKSADQIEATSSILMEDGKWMTFMTGKLKRKK